MANNFAIATVGDIYTYATLETALDAAKRNVASRNSNRNAEVMVYQAVKSVKSPLPEAIVEDVK